MFTSSESQSALPKEFGIEERLSHELYFGNRTSLVETSVCLGKVHLVKQHKYYFVFVC